MLAINDMLVRTMLVLVGAVCVAGGVIFAKQSLEVAKNIYECVLFALLIFMTGLLLVCWGFGGFPE